MSTTEPDSPRVRQLEHQIEELEAHDEVEFGHFTALDWAVCIVFGLVLPLLAIWWWAA